MDFSKQSLLIVCSLHTKKALFERIAGQAGFVQIGTSESVENAFSLLVSNPTQFDFILTEWDLKGKETGLELLRRIRGSQVLCEKTVILTAPKTSKEEVVMAINAGASSYLPQPFGVDELKKKLEIAVKTEKNRK